MKVKHYNEMMGYLTRPGFNGGGSVKKKPVLPKRKPAEEVKKRKKINYEKIKQFLGEESRELIERELGFAMGGDVETPKRGLVDEPGSYAGEVKTKSLGGGLYETTYKKGSKSYYTSVYDRETGKNKKTYFGSDKKAAAESLKEQRADRPPTKFEKLKEVKETKGTKEFKKITDKIDKKFNKVESKGYTNLREFRDEIKNLVTKDKFRNQFETQKKLNGYITDKFKDIQDVNTSNMEKALDKYNKVGGKERGTIGKIANEFGINKDTFVQNITKTGRKTIPIKYGSEYEKRKAVSEKRTAAEEKFSDPSFESKMSGTKAVQKSHMDDLYSKIVTAETMGYSPARINQEILKDVDPYFNTLYKKRDKLIKNKPAGYKKAVEEINEKGIAVALATDGYKSFQIERPDGSTYQFGVEPGKTIDPTGITEGKQIKGGVEKVQFKPQTVVTEQLEGPDKGKITKEEFGAKKPTATLTPDPVDQYLFEKNRQAVMESQAKVTKNKMKSIAKSLREAGFKCKFAGAAGGDVRCDNPINYLDDMKRNQNMAIKGSPEGKARALTKFRTAKSFLMGTLGPGALIGEALLSVPMALYYFATGADRDEIISNLTLGAFGKSQEEQLIELYGENFGLAQKAIETGERLENLERLQRGTKGQRIRSKGKYDIAVKKFEEQLSPFIKDGQFDEEAFQENRKITQLGTQKYLEEKAKRAEQIKDTLTGLELPEIDLTPFPTPNMAGGGLLKQAGDESGKPPESGPTPEDLQRAWNIYLKMV